MVKLERHVFSGINHILVVKKSHIDYFNSLSLTYISIELLYLVSISFFKLKSKIGIIDSMNINYVDILLSSIEVTSSLEVYGLAKAFGPSCHKNNMFQLYIR